MYAAERQQRIVRATQAQGRIDVVSMAETLGVTAETIRRDLSALEARGLVRRVHGGALPRVAEGFEPALESRAASHVEQKRRIARAALPLLDEGVRSILLDAGTTTTALAAELPALVQDGRELTVVTNSLSVGTALVHEPRIHLHLVGGRVRPRTLAAVGSDVEDQLRRFSVDLTFLGTNGLHADQGLTTPNSEEAAAKRAMAAAGAAVIALADSTKVGQTHLCRVAQVGDLDGIITDTGIDDEQRAELEAHGVEVVAA